MSRDQDVDQKVSRRSFLTAAGAGVAASSFAGAITLSTSEAEAQVRWDQETDIVVVGSGGAAGAAAATAHSLGNKVMVLEKSPIWGGTTAKSGGTSWVCNNFGMRGAGLTDPKEDALRYMARCSYPQLYNPSDAKLGLSEHAYGLLTAYYDHGSEAFEYLAKIGAQTTRWQGPTAGHDYQAELAEDKAPVGRHIGPQKPDGTPGNGAEMARQFKAYADEKGIKVLYEHRVVNLVMNNRRQVMGVQATNGNNKPVSVRARKGVIFGSGGFTQSPDKRLAYLRGPIMGGCAVPTNEGDFVDIGIAAGADLGNMNNAWWGEVVAEQALVNTSVPTLIWQPVGDSMIQVNKFGKRYVDEKLVYNERTQLHFYWNPKTLDYPNLITVMVYDQRAADQFNGFYPYPKKDTTAPYVINGKDIAELAGNVDARVKSLSAKLGGFKLDADFATNLQETVTRYNAFAQKGVDDDFHRGETERGKEFHRTMGGITKRLHELPNETMYPLSTTGPYYAVLIGAGTLDTKGGPKIDANGRVLDLKGKPIPGLYGAGNCIASPAGQAYWSAGGTLGPALTFGYLAAMAAHKESAKAA